MCINAGAYDDPLVKREKFACSLRSQKRDKILAHKRHSLYSKLKHMTQGQPIAASQRA